MTRLLTGLDRDGAVRTLGALSLADRLLLTHRDVTELTRSPKSSSTAARKHSDPTTSFGSAPVTTRPSR